MTSQVNRLQPLSGNNFSVSDQHFMLHALTLAKKAAERNEVPVGAVIVDAENKILGEGFNCPIQSNDATAHAEIIALRQASQVAQNYRLINTTMYVTLEPCLMCIGAMVHARVKRLVYGAPDARTGALARAFELMPDRKLNHRIEYVGGLLVDECSELLKNFFEVARMKCAKSK